MQKIYAPTHLPQMRVLSYCTTMGTVRYPLGTPYQGPTASYDTLISPDQNLARVVYGLPKPLLGHKQRIDTAFFGSLFDQLANSHAALIKVCNSESYARTFAMNMRNELPSDLYEVGVKQPDVPNPPPDVWMVIAYNRITKSMIRPGWMDPAPVMDMGRDQWIKLDEAAYVLRVSKRRAYQLVHEYEVEYKEVGERGTWHICRADVLMLANRKRRWKRRRRTR